MNDFLVGAFIIAVGFLVGSSGLSLAQAGFSTFDDVYPDNETWGQIGSHNHTKTSENGYLTLQDSQADGVFTSDIINPEGSIDIETVIYESSSLDRDKRINLTIQALTEEDAVGETFEIELEEGRYSANLGNFTEESYEQYRFIVEMFDDKATVDDKPILELLEISGTATIEQTSEGLSKGIQWLLIFVGLMVVVRNAF